MLRRPSCLGLSSFVSMSREGYRNTCDPSRWGTVNQTEWIRAVAKRKCSVDESFVHEVAYTLKSYFEVHEHYVQHS